MSATSQALFAKWHKILKTRDMEGLKNILHPDVVFRSPVVHTPYTGRNAAMVLLGNVIDVFGPSFTYKRTWLNEKSWVLEFEAVVSNKMVHGVDLIEWDSSNQIVRFDVMVRPYGGLVALREQMASRLAKL